MEVNLLKENEDGSAVFRFEMSGEEIESLVLFGLRRSLEEGIKLGKEWKDDSEADLGNT